jgi:hypothetical protein
MKNNQLEHIVCEDCKFDINILLDPLYKHTTYSYYLLGLMYYNGYIVNIDDNKVFEYLTKAVNNSYPITIYSLGLCYEYGIGCTKNPTLSHLNYQIASSLNNPHALYKMGCYYLSIKNYNSAFHYFTLSSNNHYPDAFVQLGYCYHHGYGCIKDDKMAFRYYQLASEQLTKIGLYNLGICYDCGIGCDINKEKALVCFQLAADKGEPRAQCNVAHFYEYGIACTKDMIRAYHYYKMSEELNESKDRLKDDKFKDFVNDIKLDKD